MGLGETLYYEDVEIAAGAAGYWPKDGDVDVLVALLRAPPRTTAARDSGGAGARCA